MPSLLRASRIGRVLREALALLFALFDRRANTASRVATLVSLIYLVSPIDLLPEFIPLAGIIDDLVLVPLGQTYAHSLIPEAVLARARERAAPFYRVFTLLVVVVLAFVVAALILGVLALVRLVT